MTIRLRSGGVLRNCEDRLRRFCDEEYAYYDAIASGDPNRIEPIDVLVTVAMNSRVDTAERVRAVHRGLAAGCEPILGRIPDDADLLTFDDDLVLAQQLLHAACSVPWVLGAVATKVLHRKRRGFVPMLDSVVVLYYLDAGGRGDTKGQLQDKHKAAAASMPAWRAFREDLRDARDALAPLQAAIQGSGYVMTLVRILEVLVWIEAEHRGYYREAIAGQLPTTPVSGTP